MAKIALADFRDRTALLLLGHDLISVYDNSLSVSVRCPPPNVRVFVALVSTMGSGHLGALYGGRAEEAALAG